MQDLSGLEFESHKLVLVALSFVISVLIATFGTRIPSLSGCARNTSAVQCAHTNLTPRVGGIAIFGAFCLSFFFVPDALSRPYAYFIMAAGMLFAVGLLEDISFDIPPRTRLLAAATASLLAISLLGVWMPRTDIPILDLVMHYWFVGIPLTLLVTVGMANAFNMIDGVNGLASMTAIVAAVAMSLMANQAGDTEMAHLAMMFAACVLGFFLVNYPTGLIFLGDAGAYTIGFVLSWFGISILLNAPEASPWAILLILYWPAADMFLSIYRRFLRKADTMAPDRLHVHQMVMRALEICLLGRKRRSIANPLSTLVLAPFVIAPPVVGVLFWDQPFMSFLAVIGFGVLFFASYALAPVFIRRFRRNGGPEALPHVA